MSADVVLVGGGVIGLSLARALAAGGASVTVLERGLVGAQASGAAAGMLAPLAEARGPGPFVALGLESLRRWPEFAACLRDETGLDPELRGPGMLRVAFDEAEAAALRRAFNWQSASGLLVEWLDGDAARRLEPSLSPSVVAAVRSPEERHVEPPRLVAALAQSCARRGVQIRQNETVTGFATAGNHITNVLTLTEAFSCGVVVVAGGAWTGGIGRALNVFLPISPVRGQIMALHGLPPPVCHTIYGTLGYAVPKADGRVVIGATEEAAGFDTRPTAGGLAHLLETAVRLIPALAAAPFERVWAGLRPASRDGLPILGPLPGWENAHVAAGHGRNGILLAPVTAEILAAQILGRAPHPLAAPFGAARFL